MNKKVNKQIVNIWVKMFIERREGTFNKFLKLSEPTQLEIIKEIDRIVNKRFRHE